MPFRQIVNASPLVFLVRVDLLEMLREGVDEVVVPAPVVDELRRYGPADPTVLAVDATNWLVVEPSPPIPPEIAAWTLGAGESAVLALAVGRDDHRIVVDDLGARRCAKSLSIPVIGTLGLVLRAKRSGVIPAARPLVERLRDSGMHLSDEVTDGALAQVGE